MTTRYEGLVRTAQELFDQHEESGWRLANVVYDAVEELRERGLPLRHDHRNPDRASAAKTLSVDMDRHGMSATTVWHYREAWSRYGNRADRLDGLTFQDHVVLVSRVSPKSGSYSAAVQALQKRRADKKAGRKSKFGSAQDAVAAAKFGSAAGLLNTHLRHFSIAKSNLRHILATNVWDYPDHQKVLDHLDEIQALLDQARAKPWVQRVAATAEAS